MRGVDFAAVRNAVLQGRIHLVRGKVDPEVADKEWIANSDATRGEGVAIVVPGQANGGVGGPGELATFHSLRTQHEGLRLKMAQMKLDELAGILVRREEHDRILFNEGRKVRDAVLRVPVQLAAATAAATEPGETRRLMNDALREALGGE